MNFALPRGLAISGWIFFNFTPGRRAHRFALCPGLLSAALIGLSISLTSSLNGMSLASNRQIEDDNNAHGQRSAPQSFKLKSYASQKTSSS